MRMTLVVLMTLALTGCLKTRSELRGETAPNLPVDADRYPASASTAQQAAEEQSRFYSINNDFRQLYGKIEVIEKEISDLKNSSQDGSAQAPAVESDKLQSLENRVETLEKALISIDQKLTKISEGKTSSVQVEKPKGPFGYGEYYYSLGKYEEAIASYDKYRKRYPRGKRYADATLKMGMAFNKLELNQDAKAFFKECIQRYPNTRVAVLAEKNLKKL